MVTLDNLLESTLKPGCCVNPALHLAQGTNYMYMYNKQLLDEVEHDIMNYQNRGLCYLPKPKAEANNTDTRF